MLAEKIVFKKLTYEWKRPDLEECFDEKKLVSIAAEKQILSQNLTSKRPSKLALNPRIVENHWEIWFNFE